MGNKDLFLVASNIYLDVFQRSYLKLPTVVTKVFGGDIVVYERLVEFDTTVEFVITIGVEQADILIITDDSGNIIIVIKLIIG